MANLNVDSKYGMNSGHEIPVLGYGVSLRQSVRDLELEVY